MSLKNADLDPVALTKNFTRALELAQKELEHVQQCVVAHQTGLRSVTEPWASALLRLLSAREAKQEVYRTLVAIQRLSQETS